MIFYFSATGNSKYVAQRLADETKEELVDITQCRKQSRYRFRLKAKERIGFVTPTYFWGLPAIVEEFLDRMELIGEGKHYVYHVLTFGTVTGAASLDLAKVLEKKGYPLNAAFSVRMVDTWTPFFDLNDKEKNRRNTAKAEVFIHMIIPKVVMKMSGDFNKNKGLFYGASPAARKAYNMARKTRKFKVKETCTGCGLCEKCCPEEAIVVRGGKPTWVNKKCSLCLGCMHRCPQAAIVYGNHTENRGQFVNPNCK